MVDGDTKLTQSVIDFIMSNPLYEYEVMSVDAANESMKKGYTCIEVTLKYSTSFNVVEAVVWIKNKYLDERLYKYFRYQKMDTNKFHDEIVPIEIGENALNEI